MKENSLKTETDLEYKRERNNVWIKIRSQGRLPLKKTNTVWSKIKLVFVQVGHEHEMQFVVQMERNTSNYQIWYSSDNYI